MSSRLSADSESKGYSSSSSSSSTSSSSPCNRSRESKSPSRSKSRSRSRSRSPRSPGRKENQRRRSHDITSARPRTESRREEDIHKIDDSIRSDKSSKPVYCARDDQNADIGLQVPPPPRISKTPIQFGRPGTIARPGIHMKLATVKPKTQPQKKITVASAFNNDSDEEVEEMPPECKMRMRNIGRDTPTSSGPNSFGKTKQGFIDSKKLFEKSLREAAED